MTRKRVLIVAAIIGVVCLIFFIAGIVFFVQGSRKSDQSKTSTSSDSCSYSAEAKRIGLEKILKKAQDSYYKLTPELIHFKPDVSEKELRETYIPTDYSPKRIKDRTDAIRVLYKELFDNLKVDTNKLKQREKKALAQLKFFMKNSFSSSGEGNYYTGNWMMGPDNFCYKSICYIENEIYNELSNSKPSTMEDMEALRDKLIKLNNTFGQYVENLKLGVQAGMVGSQEACYSGYQAIGQRYPNIYRKGPQGG